jgi:cytochrome c biogenesis protein CcmG/thiol:disulfide interchange protein DsbE
MTAEQPAAPRRIWIGLIPVLLFAGLAIMFWRGLSGNPSEIPSALIGQPVPVFELGGIEGYELPGLKTADFQQGKIMVVNVWASWCVPCRAEHPLLMELAKRKDISVVGINYKDRPENARKFLDSMGQPFSAIGADEAGRSAVDWGVYGVPETFVVDGKGIIRYKLIGPLDQERIDKTLNAEIEKAKST